MLWTGAQGDRQKVEVNTSVYFGTLALVNICLGIAATVLTWLVGLPHPFLWACLLRC